MQRPGCRARASDCFRRNEVNVGDRRWSLYGAPWLQPVAISGKVTRSQEPQK
jgi:hypothetical protein